MSPGETHEPPVNLTNKETQVPLSLIGETHEPPTQTLRIGETHELPPLFFPHNQATGETQEPPIPLLNTTQPGEPTDPPDEVPTCPMPSLSRWNHLLPLLLSHPANSNR